MPAFRFFKALLELLDLIVSHLQLKSIVQYTYALTPCELLVFLLPRCSTRLMGTFRGALVAFLGAKSSVPVLSV